jgi:hypothetical protein
MAINPLRRFSSIIREPVPFIVGTKSRSMRAVSIIPVPPGDPRIFGEQLGPTRSSRAMAIVHIAIFDTIDAVDRSCQSFTGVQATQHPLSLIAAVSQSAHDTLVALYPSQTAAFDAPLAEDLARGPQQHRKSEWH